jgi:AMP-binding enzyme
MRNLPEWTAEFFAAARRCDRHAAQRLVDRSRARIRVEQCRRESGVRRHRAIRAAQVALRDFLHLGNDRQTEGCARHAPERHDRNLHGRRRRAKSASSGCGGPMVVKGYWNNPQATAQTSSMAGCVPTMSRHRCRWLLLHRRSRQGHADPGRREHLLHRSRERAVRASGRDGCRAGRHPASGAGGRAGAVVQLKPGATATEEELRAWVARQLAAFKVPLRVLLWRDTLPRNPAGKILQNELKAAFNTLTHL